MKNRIYVFDLDGTVVDSSHRTPSKSDGTLDLDGYKALRCRESIFKDSPLPLMEFAKRKYARGEFVVVCTSRELGDEDLDFFASMGFTWHLMMSRNNITDEHYACGDAEYKRRHLTALCEGDFADSPKIFFDDNTSVCQMATDALPMFTVVKIER